MNLGFEISSSTITVLVVTFILYSIIITSFGAYVKYAARKDTANQKLKDYLTGGGGLGPIAVGMLTFTGLMSAGGAVGGPGTGYSIGFTWSVAVWSGFIFGALVPFTVGKKMAIMSKRIGAVSLIALFRHRFGNSKAYAYILAIIFTTFFGAMTIGQFAGGGKVFAVMSGTGNNTLGVLIFAVVTVIYTATGGIKSIAKIAVIQGFVMVGTVIFMYVGVVSKVSADYGGIQGMVEWLAANNPKLVVAETWTPLYMGGTALLMSSCIFAMPNGLISGFTYNKSSAVLRGGVIAILCATLYQFVMSGMGPFAYSLGQNLTSGDYATTFIAITVLPDALAGLVVAGIASAIQSTIAAILIIVASSIVIDLYRDVINPKAEAAKLNKMTTIVTIAFGVICMLIALRPTNMIQMFINFTSGGMSSALIWPVLFGFYSKRATTAGAIGATLGGALVYGGCYIMSSIEPMKTWWITNMGNCHAVIPGLIASLIIMLICNKVAKPVEKGRLQVWFNKDYDDEWASVGK